MLSSLGVATRLSLTPTRVQCAWGSHGHTGPCRLELGAAAWFFQASVESALWRAHRPQLRCKLFMPSPHSPLHPSSSKGLLNDSPRESLGSAALGEWTCLHFSPWTPSPLTGLHLEFIFSRLEMVQAVLYGCLGLQGVLHFQQLYREERFPGVNHRPQRLIDGCLEE